MPIIYEPKGKAAEYCSLAVNLYRGCSHGCKYCYAPSATFQDRQDFHNNVIPRKGILETLKKEAPSYKGQDIHFCFTCDPYQEIEMQLKITRQAIKILKDSGCNVVILTKGGQRSLRDMDLLTSSDKYGATLTFYDEALSNHWEPGAAIPQERLQALKAAKLRGI